MRCNDSNDAKTVEEAEGYLSAQECHLSFPSIFNNVVSSRSLLCDYLRLDNSVLQLSCKERQVLLSIIFTVYSIEMSIPKTICKKHCPQPDCIHLVLHMKNIFWKHLYTFALLHLKYNVNKSGKKWCTLCILFYDGVEIISRMYTEQVYFYDC